MASNDHLQAALETYEKHRTELMAQGVGRYVLVHGDEIAGVWETYEDALKVGYEKYGIDAQFLVKKIDGPIDGLQFFSRDFAACQR